jgi:hypothetical protein
VRDPVNEIHGVPDADVQAHVESVVTLIVPVPPLGGVVTVSGATVYVHVPACSVTTKFLPAITNVAVLDCVVGFDAAVIPTLPEPVPVLPFAIVTHVEPLVAVHVQLAVVVTVTVLLPPAAANV